MPLNYRPRNSNSSNDQTDNSEESKGFEDLDINLESEGTSTKENKAYVEALNEGYVGTEAEWLEWLKTKRDEELVDASIQRMENIIETKPFRLFTPMRTFVLLVIFLLTTAIIYAKDNYVKTYENYQRICKLPEISGMELTAIRSYNFPIHTLLGYTLRVNSEASITTVLQPTFTATNITILKDHTWKSYFTTKGEPTVVNLEAADSYIFTQENKTYVITSSDFCK